MGGDVMNVRIVERDLLDQDLDVIVKAPFMPCD